MDLLVKNLESDELFIDADSECIDICVVSKEGKQFDFTLTHKEWEAVCNYVKQMSTV